MLDLRSLNPSRLAVITMVLLLLPILPIDDVNASTSKVPGMDVGPVAAAHSTSPHQQNAVGKTLLPFLPYLMVTEETFAAIICKKIFFITSKTIKGGSGLLLWKMGSRNRNENFADKHVVYGTIAVRAWLLW